MGSSYFPTFSWPIIAAQVIGLFLAWTFATCFMSPIRNIPGPVLASFSRLWHIIHIVRGDQNVELVNLHEKLGT